MKQKFPKFEYAQFKNLSEQNLNHYGLIGWELVSVHTINDESGTSDTVYTFKRERAK